MWKDFRDFITKGNLVQLAVAFVMGAAFGIVVGSFVNDLVMPLIGKLIGNVDFANLYVNLSGTTYESAAAARQAGAAAIYYGAFINTLINFVVVALAVFFVVKAYQRSQRPKAGAAPTTKVCPYCKSAIAIGATRCPHCTSQFS
jgi:large conductance mechanosensitive channel